jgi:hypothetical protein
VPAALDLTVVGQTTPYGTGIISRKGDTMQVLYSWGLARPNSFDRPLASYYLLTLARKR